jgi:hypothetical protein
MIHPHDAHDLRPFSEEVSDTEKINGGHWVPCRICREIYARIRLTVRYCGNCGRAFCEGEHGRFAMGQKAFCVRCYNGGPSTELANTIGMTMS